MSILDLITNAGLVVQLIMLVLVLMSIYSWTLIMSKKTIIIKARQSIKTFRKSFKNTTDLKDFYARIPSQSTNQDAMQRIFYDGFNEFSNDSNNSERAYRIMLNAANNEAEKLDHDLPFLAMIASSSPYIGLFGTVWGIMHSFIGIAGEKNATIAIVAPGIAEALIATAFGLFAAIPATIAYNSLSTSTTWLANQYDSLAEQLFIIFQKS